MSKNGFTLVEAIIVIVVIVAILAILIPILRERERQRLQAVADAEPWEVFEFRAEPAKDSFAEDEIIVVHCEIVNPTGYLLSLPKDLDNFHLFFRETNFIAGASSIQYPILRTAIAPGDSANFDVAFAPSGTGVSEFRILYDKGKSEIAIGEVPRVGPRQFETFTVRDVLPSAEKRFQSHAFQLVVKEGNLSQLPTFDETLAFTEIVELSSSR